MSEQKVCVGFGVMIFKNSKVLLGLRHSDPEKADSELHGEGTWTMPGGKIHFGESFEEVCYREVLEECSLKIDKKKLKLISVANDIANEAHFVTIGFLCRDFKGRAKVMEPDEIIKWKWFSLKKLPKKIFFPSQKVIENYLAKKIYRK